MILIKNFNKNINYYNNFNLKVLNYCILLKIKNLKHYLFQHSKLKAYDFVSDLVTIKYTFVVKIKKLLKRLKNYYLRFYRMTNN